MSYHDQIDAADNHGPYRRLFANDAARTGDAGPYTAADVTNRVKALQLDTLDEYVLTAATPTWTVLPGTTPGAVTHASTTGQTADDHHAESHSHGSHTGIGADDHHAQAHTVASHSDTSATGAQLDTLTDGSNADTLHVHAAAPGGTFGADYQFAASNGRSTTTSVIFQTKTTLTTPTLTGTYRISWIASVDQSNIADSVEARLRDTTNGQTLQNADDQAHHEPKDSDNRIHTGSFLERVFTAESITMEIQYRQQNGSTAGISNARIEIWRVA